MDINVLKRLHDIQRKTVYSLLRLEIKKLLIEQGLADELFVEMNKPGLVVLSINRIPNCLNYTLASETTFALNELHVKYRFKRYNRLEAFLRRIMAGLGGYHSPARYCTSISLYCSDNETVKVIPELNCPYVMVVDQDNYKLESGIAADVLTDFKYPVANKVFDFHEDKICPKVWNLYVLIVELSNIINVINENVVTSSDGLDTLLDRGMDISSAIDSVLTSLD